MRTFNIVVHVLTAIVLILNGLVLFLPAIMTSFLSAIFEGNLSGIIMLAASILLIAVGVITAKTAFSCAALIATDPSSYRAQELKLVLYALALSGLGLLVILAFHQFSVAQVVEYGFMPFFVAYASVASLNLVSGLLTFATVHA